MGEFRGLDILEDATCKQRICSALTGHDGTMALVAVDKPVGLDVAIKKLGCKDEHASVCPRSPGRWALSSYQCWESRKGAMKNSALK